MVAKSVTNNYVGLITEEELASYNRSFARLHVQNIRIIISQRRQSGLKSGVVDPGQKISIFLGKFPKNFDF